MTCTNPSIKVAKRGFLRIERMGRRNRGTADSTESGGDGFRSDGAVNDGVRVLLKQRGE